MRKSLQKMPHSALSSRLAAVPPAVLPAVLAAGAGPSRAAKRNGSAQSTRLARFAVTVADDDQLRDRVRLLEAFVSHGEIVDCAQYALQWLTESLRLSPSICLVRSTEEDPFLRVAAAYGAIGSGAASY